MIFAIAIGGLNVATGYTGLISVGHSAFFGLGAYTTGILVVHHGWQPALTLPVALVLCFLAGLVVGLPALRIRGLYLAMVTLSFGVAFPELVARFDGLTGGSAGLTIRARMLLPPSWSGFHRPARTCGCTGVSARAPPRRARQPATWSAAGTAWRCSRRGTTRSRPRPPASTSPSSRRSPSGCPARSPVSAGLFAMYLGSLVADDSFTLLKSIALLTGLVIGGRRRCSGRWSAPWPWCSCPT